MKDGLKKVKSKNDIPTAISPTDSSILTRVDTDKEQEVLSKSIFKKLAVKDYVHLHNHTQYSLLDGLSKIPKLMEKIKSDGMNAVAITDHGTLSGVVEFYKTAKAADINPIIGLETYIAPRSHTDKDASKDKTPYHLILLAMNNKGYKNLMKLSTIANLDGFYYKPRIDHDLLEKYNEGLIVLSGCIGGEIGDALRNNQYQTAKDIATWYSSIFGDRYYLEIQDHGHTDHPSKWDEQVKVTDLTLKLAKELNIPTVVTCDAHYLRHTDQEAHEILLCVQTGSFLTDQNRMSLKNFDLHVTEPEDIISRWGKSHPELILNSSKIAKRCHVELELGRILIPKFSVPKHETEQTYLEKLVYQGLVGRYSNQDNISVENMDVISAQKLLPKEIIKRAKYELSIIENMGFNGYFLIIADFINWGKNKGIVFGPGRGSAAGSIIAFALRITEIDPLKYDLLFERFLNPDRISMPDIDIDIQDSRRDEVIQYCVEKYGTNRVANIVTFGRMAARNSIRDVARVMQVPYAESDRLAKMIPQPIQGRHTPLDVSLKNDIDLKHEYESNQQSRTVFDLAVQLEGTIRSHGVHAAGVVIAPDDIVDYAPLEMAQKGVVATQYSMGPIEDLGLLKMDFLGLSNLTIIKNTLRIIKKVNNEDLDINSISLEDDKTFELLQRGDTTGVFQLESAGMKRYLKELKPTVFDDIIAMVALYRPGPMQWIDDFIARKHGNRAIEYFHEAMKPALMNTYGIVVYQEQVMQISKEMCGFTGGQADTLRKAIGKKDPTVLAKLKGDFIEGAIKTVNAPREDMEKFWGQLEDFAAYCFNKSHAACYALISYWTAYLKAHYPAAFMAALMTSDYDNTDRLAIEINECKHMGLVVMAPDVNESFLEFAVVPGTNQIRFGMSAIKNVGTAAAEEIIRARSEGAFNNLETFLSSVQVKIVNRKALESFIKSGALDRFGERGVLLNNIDSMLIYANRIQKQKSNGQTDLFSGSLNVKMPSVTKFKLDTTGVQHYLSNEYLTWERELLGIYVSEHPLEAFSTILQELTVSIQDLTSAHDGRNVTLGGLVTSNREIITKKGQKMSFVTLSDQSSDIELIVFPNVYQQTIGIWDIDNVVIVKGKLTSTDKDGNIIDDIKLVTNEGREVTFEQAKAYQSTGKKLRVPKKISNLKVNSKKSLDNQKRLYIRLPNTQDQKLLISLKKTIDQHSGLIEVFLVIGDGDKRQIIKLPSKINGQDESLQDIYKIVGESNVKFNE